MSRGKGIKAKTCYCQVCQRNFKACREDAVTCSARCRKRRNRLLGGPPIEVKESVTAITDAQKKEANA